jgi:hypothetical protein
MGTLCEDQYTFSVIRVSRLILRKKNVSDKSCRENQTSHFMLSNFLENRATYEIMWKNIVKLGGPQMTIWHVHFACWIPEATNTHSDYIILLLFHCCNGCTNAPQCYVHYLFCFCITNDLPWRVVRHKWGSKVLLFMDGSCIHVRVFP